MASKDSRLLREGKERNLVLETIKTKIGHKQVEKVLCYHFKRCYKIDDDLIYSLELQGFYFGEIKVKVVYKNLVAEVKGDVYWIDIMELNEYPRRWI